jgi:hypothetical protein
VNYVTQILALQELVSDEPSNEAIPWSSLTSGLITTVSIAADSS